MSQPARLPSLRSRLVLLALAILVPALCAGALTLYAGYRHARQEVEKHLQETSRALSLAIDRQLGQAEALLWSLSASPMLRAANYAGFDALAREAVRIPGAWVVVEEDGRQLVNTHLPPGSALPAPGTAYRQGMRPGQIRISNLFTGTVAQQPAVAVDTLIDVEGGGQRNLSVIMPAATVARILADQALPAGWVGAIADRNGTVVARAPDHDRFVGRPATGDNLERIRGGVTQGVFESISLAGIETVLALSRSPASGWTTILAVPRAELSAGIRQLAVYLAAAAGLLSALGAALAIYVARRIARPVEALAADAEALAQGCRAPASPAGHLPDTRETAALRRAFQDACTAVGQREAERDQAAVALREVNATLEARVADRTCDLARANASLRESQETLSNREALYSSVFKFNADGLFVVQVTKDVELIVETYNPAIELLIGKSVEDARGLPLAEVVPPALLPLIEGRIRECLARAEPISYERSFAFAARRGVWAVTLVPIRDASGRIVRVLGSNRDITRERDTEAEIKASRDRYSALFEYSPLDLAVIDVRPDGAFVYEEANPTLLRSLGFSREAFVGYQPHELFPTEPATYVVERYRECVRTRSLVEYEVSGRAPAGDVVRRSVLVPLLDDSGRVAKIFVTSMDLTEQRRMEERLRQSERMETVGQLTGGIAHDFNNLLTVVMGNLDMLRRAKPERAPRLIDNALAAVEQGRKLTGQLLAFSRRQPLKPEVVDLAGLICRMDGLLAQSLRGDIVLEIDVAEGLWPVEVDSTQLQSALINLAANARDAMPNGGAFRIRAQNRVSQEANGAEGVAIQVSDTGTGIAPEDLPRVFEPFFTTKETGKGTGLGLAQVYGFVQQSGGTVDIMSEPGRGTTLILMLPRAVQSAQSLPAPPTVGLQRGRALRILLVEDNAQVAELATELLQEAGHEIESATTGQDALNRLAVAADFDLMFSDLVMPGGINGVELARTVRRRWPDLPILLATGYSSESAKAQREGFRLLSKPYEPAALLAAVAEVAAAARPKAKVIPLRPA